MADVTDVSMSAEPDDLDLSLTDPVEQGEPVAVESAGVRTKKKLGIMFWVAVAFLVLLTLSAILAEVLPFLSEPDERYSERRSEGPQWRHPLGLDKSGRDIFTRVIYGAQVSLIVATVGTILAFVFGGMVGLTAGYFRGRVDAIITTVTDATLVIPGLILALSLILFLDNEAERRVPILILVFVLLSVAPIGRVVRASTLVWSEREFVLAAKTMGARNGRIMFRDILPNVAPALISYSLIIMANLIVVEGAVSFIGLSVPPPTPTWGDMINKGRADLGELPHITLMPAMAMFATVLALNFVGDKLQERFEPRESVL